MAKSRFMSGSILPHRAGGPYLNFKIALNLVLKNAKNIYHIHNLIWILLFVHK